MSSILIIEDEEVILKALKRLLERNGYVVEAAMSIQEALALSPHRFDLILADLRLPGGEGTDIIPAAGKVPVVIMTSHASVRSAVSAMREGAIDYIAKPFDHEELLMVIERSLLQNRLLTLNNSLKHDLQRLLPTQKIVNSSCMQSVLSEIGELRDHQRNLYLHGERGTEKELLARALHHNSERSDAQIVVADLPGIETEHAEAILFDNTDNLLQSANNGTLVLRHPHYLAKSVQTRLLDCLSSKSIQGVNGSRKLNIRTICIGNHSLTKLVDEYGLLAPLAELFSENTFEVPPLRDFRNDLPMLAEHYLSYYKVQYAKDKLKYSGRALAAIRSYHWPGNIDELKVAIEKATLITNTSEIHPQDLGLGLMDNTSVSTVQNISLDDYFRYVVLQHQSTLSETELAQALGISRKALWERRQKMQLQRESDKPLAS